MFWKRLFATKSLEQLHAEMAGENRLRRVLGPIGLTSLGVGAIIGAGIFVMTGEVAANDAGPGVLLSFVVAGIACALAALCYAEFASMAPVAGSAYTYAYATLGELFAWIIGWDLILEYAVSAATVAASWTSYYNHFLKIVFGFEVHEALSSDPSVPGAWFNMPAVCILLAVTAVLVIGIRESAASNTALVLVKVGVILFVIAMGVGYIDPANWTSIPVEDRKLPEQRVLSSLANQRAQEEAKTNNQLDVSERAKVLGAQALAALKIQNAANDPERLQRTKERYAQDLPQTRADNDAVDAILTKARAKGREEARKSWGMWGLLGLDQTLAQVDEATRSRFMPYGISGVMLGAALVFFAFLGFDSISTHAEEAVRPQRDVPIGILSSLLICTLLYMAVSAVITGMVPYPDIDTGAAVASAFSDRAQAGGGALLNASSALIALGGLAGMTSVLLITFLSQARIFLAMARDGLMPRGIFAAVHEKFRTPHLSTMVTGGLMAVVAAFTPVGDLVNMVNIGTFFAFVVVCAAVLLLRIKRPDAARPFRCPAVYLLAPLGIVVNFTMMMFLDRVTWLRLVIWLVIGLAIYFVFGYRHSALHEREAAA